eukprot:100385-Chlamydomonas_euryale.AAC.17
MKFKHEGAHEDTDPNTSEDEYYAPSHGKKHKNKAQRSSGGMKSDKGGGAGGSRARPTNNQLLQGVRLHETQLNSRGEALEHNFYSFGGAGHMLQRAPLWACHAGWWLYPTESAMLAGISTLYKAYFRWEHENLAIPDHSPLPIDTDACPSVTSCFLQVRHRRYGRLHFVPHSTRPPPRQLGQTRHVAFFVAGSAGVAPS